MVAEGTASTAEPVEVPELVSVIVEGDHEAPVIPLGTEGVNVTEEPGALSPAQARVSLACPGVWATPPWVSVGTTANAGQSGGPVTTEVPVRVPVRTLL